MAELKVIEQGTIDIAPRYKGDSIRDHIIPGTFPMRYWIIAEGTDDETREQPVKRCARCEREIKPKYKYCYRCFNYLQVKRRIAAA